MHTPIPPPPPKPNTHGKLRTLISLSEVSSIFDVSPLIAKGRISTTPHVSTGKNGVYLWEINDICELIDKRIERDTINALISKTKRNNASAESGVEINPSNLTPANFKLHYQGLDIREAFLSKKYRNDVFTGELLTAIDVEEHVIMSFKTVVDFLSALPDRMERDGVIESHKVMDVIAYIDSIRDQLASDLEELTNE